MNNLRTLLAQLAAHKTPGLALDIDDTICDTMGRWVDGLTCAFGNPLNCSAEEIREHFERCEDVPGWQHDRALEWMRARIHDDAYQLGFDCMPGAREHVSAIHTNVPIHAYLTARPHCVLDGTRRWLARHNFPDVPIITRPPEIEHANNAEWKATILQELYPHLCGIIDNDTKVANALPSTYRGTMYLLSRKPFSRDDVRVVRCETWKKLAENIF